MKQRRASDLLVCHPFAWYFYMFAGGAIIVFVVMDFVVGGLTM